MINKIKKKKNIDSLFKLSFGIVFGLLMGFEAGCFIALFAIILT